MNSNNMAGALTFKDDAGNDIGGIVNATEDDLFEAAYDDRNFEAAAPKEGRFVVTTWDMNGYLITASPTAKTYHDVVNRYTQAEAERVAAQQAEDYPDEGWMAMPYGDFLVRHFVRWGH